MFKKIIKNKSLLVSLLSFCFALFAMVSISFAWFTVTKNANTGSFGGVVENASVESQFSQVVDNGVVHTDSVHTDNAIPGEQNTFILTIKNDGTIVSNLDVYFFNIFSEINNSKDYGQEAFKKVQYAYSYCIDLVAYTPSDIDSTQIEIEKDPTTGFAIIPDETQVTNNSWVTHTRNTEYTYFNQTNVDGTDQTNYPMVDHLTLQPKEKDANRVYTAAEQTAVIIYFTIRFNSEPILPNGVEKPNDPNINFDGEYYANQRFNITNIIIQGLK